MFKQYSTTINVYVSLEHVNTLLPTDISNLSSIQDLWQSASTRFRLSSAFFAFLHTDENLYIDEPCSWSVVILQPSYALVAL
jgi:hypothetical protein